MRKLKCNDCPNIITKKYDGQSKKMLQAQMLKTPKSYKLKYSNSANDNIVRIIISNDYDSNKGLLLCYKFNRYSELISPFILKFPKIDIVGLLDKIILELSESERKRVFNIKEEVPVITDTQILYENKKTFYVVTAYLFGFYSFIFKNYTNDVFIPTYSYTFDLSHISNAEKRDETDNTKIIKPESKLSFSIDKNWIPYTHLTYNGTPGTAGANVIVTIPQSIKTGQLYIYNAASTNVAINYILWGYNLENFTVLLDSIKESILPICKNIPSGLEYQKIPDETINTLSTVYQIICMTRSSLLLVNNTYGVVLYFDDIKIRRGLGFNNIVKYGLYSGDYYIYVPPEYELTFFNKSDSNFIFSGDNTKKSTDTIDGVVYDFYYGTIKIVITGSFQPISIYTKSYGYLNCKDIMIYSETCSFILPDEKPYLIPYI
uniref:Uncharacterized protein n=1 Tax=viral metagenome TaxID=1070528 RepID=A0A6C0JN98_9ZZZZ